MSYSEGNSYEEILARCLSDERLNNIDKREGSIIYDALAPLCLELAETYIKLDIMNDQSYLLTATGENLDNKVYDYGLTREQATPAERVGTFKKYKTDDNGQYIVDEEGNKILIDMEVPIGSRFTLPNNPNLIFNMKEIRKIDDVPTNVLECESAGSGANSYVGLILPITPIANLVKAEIGNIITPGSDTETDDELRARTKEYLTNIAFGGNIADYRNKIEEQDGFGISKVFPSYSDPNQAVISVRLINNTPLSTEILDKVINTVLENVEEVSTVKKLDFNGGVVVSVLSDDYTPLSPQSISKLQEIIDPDSAGSGYGLAPIGHYVTVTTPTEAKLTVNLSVNVSIDTTVADEEESIIEAIQEYVKVVRKNFAKTNDTVLQITVARVINAILNYCPKVTNVTNVVLNKGTTSESTDTISYVDTEEVQYIPAIPTSSDIVILENV